MPGRQELAVLLEQVAQGELVRLEGLRKRRPIHHKMDYEELPEFAAMKSDGRRRLEAFDRALEYLLTVGGKRLGHLQVKLWKEIRIAAIRKIFGETLTENLDYLREKYGITDIHDCVAIIFPRRSGKTITQVIAAACFAVSQPDGNIVCFNLGTISLRLN